MVTPTITTIAHRRWYICHTTTVTTSNLTVFRTLIFFADVVLNGDDLRTVGGNTRDHTVVPPKDPHSRNHHAALNVHRNSSRVMAVVKVAQNQEAPEISSLWAFFLNPPKFPISYRSQTNELSFSQDVEFFPV